MRPLPNRGGSSHWASEAVVQAGFREPPVGFRDLFGQAGASLGLEAVMPSAHILVEIFSGSVAGRRSPQSSMRTSGSAALKWVAVPRLDRGGDAATESNCV